MSKWLKADGSLDLDALDALAANVKAVTDSNAAIDAVIKGAKIGAPVVVAFKCNHSGKYFPGDYVKQWGRLYGHGLGPDPVSEALDSDYATDPPKITEQTNSINQIMHPLTVTRVQVDLMNVPEDEYNANQLILAIDDPRMEKRAPILLENQFNKSDKLIALHTNWAQITGMRLGRKAVA